MRYIKTYEMCQTEPEIGDYVICEETSQVPINKSEPKARIFIAQNIGKIIAKCRNNSNLYIVEYENVPKEIENNFDLDDQGKYYQNVRTMFEREILHCAKNPKDLEIYLDANKYNL